MRKALGALAITFAALTQAPIGAAQQQPLGLATAVAPDTVTVGDPFNSVVRVMAPPGALVEFRGVEMADSVQQVDTVRVIGAAADSGATAAYRLVAWVAAPVRATAEVWVVYPDSSEAVYRVPLAVPVLRSVLPPGELPPPRPGRGVVPLQRGAVLWPWVLAASAIAVALLLYAILRRRRPAREVLADPRPPALAALTELEAERDPALQYERAARVLRRYLADLQPRWGEEWTTTELIDRSGELPTEAVRVLADILDRADRVKFAGVRPVHEAGHEFVARVRGWIESYPPPATGAARPREAA